MCFTKTFKKRVTREQAIIPLIAKKDIICYKRLDPRFGYKRRKGYSQFGHYGYYETVRKEGKYVTPYRQYPMELGMHYYQTNQKFTFSCNRGKIGRLDINRGLHSHVSFKIAEENRQFSEVIVKCIIPKGSQYFKNETDIVSDNLILLKEKSSF